MPGVRRRRSTGAISAIELAAAMVGAAAIVAHPLPLGAASPPCFGWWLLLLVALDLEHHWLPDRLTLPLIPLGLAAAWAGFGPPLADRAIGAAVGLGRAVPRSPGSIARLRGREGMGGGDPKLLAGARRLARLDAAALRPARRGAARAGRGAC